MPIDRSCLARSANLLLRCLGAADQALIAPHLEEVSFARDATILHTGRPLDALFFPTAGVISLQERLDASRSVEVAVVGREGLLGWPVLLGGERSSYATIVRMADSTLLRIGAEPLRAACDRSPSLRSSLLAFVHVFIVQTTCAITSHLGHSLEKRVARWLLMRHDRVGGDILLVHHDDIAASLNVRRASITDQLHLLEGRRLIRSTRGRIIVRDRAALEAFAGEAYGSPEEQYRALIGPFGKSAESAVAPKQPSASEPIMPMHRTLTPTMELEL